MRLYFALCPSAPLNDFTRMIASELPRFILASQSPARLQLLKLAGISAIAQPSHFDESLITSSHPQELVQNLAAGKAQVVAKQRSPAHEVILGCDSVLEINGAIHGKPKDALEAIARWKLMRNQVGHLYTGHALIDQTSRQHCVRYQCTHVHFANITDAQIEAYVRSEEPLHCAGCFALDGRGGLFIRKIEGCHSNVIGLSLPLLTQMLEELGYDVTDFWDA